MTEMYMKIIGAVLTVLSGLGIGLAGCQEMKEREMALRGVMRMLSLLKEEIRFGNIPLREAFHRVGGRMQGEFQECLERIAKKMGKGETDSFPVVFRKSVQASLGTLPFSREEWETLLGIGEHLGYLDVTVQTKELEQLREIFEEYHKNLSVEMKGKIRMYRSLSVLGSFMLVVLIW